jgi:hypothetical protein
METEHEIRDYIRNVLTESINNFLEKEKGTAIKELDNNSKAQELGDPILDTKMNKMANELGSDGENAPTVAVKAGSVKGGNGPEVGQRWANFKGKTDQA